MNPNLRHQVHYGTLQVHGNAATMNSNLQYGNAQSATFFPASMPNKVYNQPASVMVNNQGFVAMNMDGFDAGQGQRIVGMQGTMAAQMQGAISMTANISPQFNNGGSGHSFNMTNGTMIPGSMMSTPGNMMQSSPGNILQASPNIMQGQNNIPVMQTSNNMVQGPGNMMQFYKGMNPGMMNSPNGLPGMNFSPQNSNVLPSFSQLFGTCSPGSQFQNNNQQQVHQGTVINSGNAGGFENFVQNVVVNTPAQHVQQFQQQQHPLGQTFVNVYNQRQPVNTNSVNVNHFTCMPYKQGDSVFMMTPTNLNNKFNSTMPVATVASHARPDCRFSGPGPGTNPGNIHIPISQPANVIDHSQTRQLVTQASTMVTTTVYSHANLTCSSVSSGLHSQCVAQRPPSNCGHNHLSSERTSHCALVSRPSSVSSCITTPVAVSQCRTKLLDNGKQVMSSSTTISLPSSQQDTFVSSVKCSSESDIVLPTTTASCTITSTTVSVEGPVCPKISTITVPFGWRRVVEQGVIIYYSPSDTRLQSSECVRQYLQSDGTCKCGLECPLLVDEVFSFDTHVKSKAWEVSDVTCKTDPKKFCNHKRKTIAMATLKNSQSMQTLSESTEKNNNEPASSPTVSATSSQAVKKEGKSKKKKGNKNKSSSGPYDGVLVSQLLAQRDKTKTSAGRNSLHVPLSKELSSLIDAALGNTDSSPKKQSTDETHKKDSHVDAKGEPGVQNNYVSSEQTSAVPASKQTNICSNVLKQVEKRDPMDDLGPITCHVPGKLDFSLGRPMSNCQHMFNRSPMLSPGLPNNQCIPSNPSHNNPLSIQTSFGQETYKNQRIFLQSPPCNTGHNTPCDVSMQMPGYVLGDQMAQGYSDNHGGGMMPDQLMNMQAPVRFPAAFNHNQQTGNLYHCAPPQHPYMPLSSIRNNLSAPWMEQSRAKPKRPRPKAKKKDRKKYKERASPCPNIDVRSMHIQTDVAADSGNTPATMASFLDNPTAFLAQQTALVHNSMATSSQGLHSAPGGIVDCINKNILPSHGLSNKGSLDGNQSDENKKPILNHEQHTMYSQTETGPLLTCKSEPEDTFPATTLSVGSDVNYTTNFSSPSESGDKKTPHTDKDKEEIVTTNRSKKDENTPGNEVRSDQRVNEKLELAEKSISINTSSEREGEQHDQTNTLKEDHVHKASVESRKPSLHPKTKDPKTLKHTLKKPSGNFPASTLLSAAARAQLASQIQTHVNSKVYMKSNSTSPCSRMSTASGCTMNNSSNCDPDGSSSVHSSHPKNRFDGQKLNVARHNKMTSLPIITQCCLEDNPNKINGFNSLYGGMNQPLSHLSSEFSKEQSPIQMVQNVVASIDGKSDMYKTNLFNASGMPDPNNLKHKDCNPLLQELSMDMGKSTGTVQDPAHKTSMQHLVNQALLQQGLNMNSIPLGGHVPLLGVGSGLQSGPVSGLGSMTANNNLSQMIPTMGLTQPVIAQQPLLQLISTLNLNTNNPMLLSSPSLNSPNQNPMGGNLSAPQMMGVSISRPQVPNTDGTYGMDSMAQTSVHVNQSDQQFEQNYPGIDIKTSEDLKTSTSTVMDGMKQNPATCPAQLVLLPQLQMPMVQMMGPNQMQINSNCMEKNNINNINLNLNMTQMVVPGQATPPQNISMFSPNVANNNVNLFNLQQMMNLCSATNVTTAQLQQLQCLQLQQQLLQQYMQTLINQLGVQGMVNNQAAHPEKTEPENNEVKQCAYIGSGEKNTTNTTGAMEMQDSNRKSLSQEVEELSKASETENMVQEEDILDNASTDASTCEPESENVFKTECYDSPTASDENQGKIKSETVIDNSARLQISGVANDKDSSCHQDLSDTEEGSKSAVSDLGKDDTVNTKCANKDVSVSPNTKTEASELSKSSTVDVGSGKSLSTVNLADNHIADHSYEGMVVDCGPVAGGGDIEAGSSQIDSGPKSSQDDDSSTNQECEDSNASDDLCNETDSVTGEQGLEVCDGPTTGDQLMVMANGPPTDIEYRHEDTSSLDGLSSSEDEKIDEIFANHRGLKRVLRDNRDSLLDDEDSLDFDDKAIGVFPRNFNVGDLVWGQIRGFPSWPGKLVHENQVKGKPKTDDGKLWVKWFGDHTCTQVEPDKLKTLSEGLEAHHRARKKYRKGRKMNSHLESAIQEAMNELDRPTENVEPVSQTNRYVKGRPMKKRRTR